MTWSSFSFLCKLKVMIQFGAVLGIVAGGFVAPLWASDEQPSRPNILVLLADDVDARDYGCYGNEAIKTPNIDSLAADGLLCTQAFLTTPQCSPTRISVLSGRYPHATGAEDLHTPLPEGIRLIPSYLQEQGYFTGHLQKTHFGPRGEAQFQWYSRDLEDFEKFLDAAEEQPFFMWVGFRDAHRPYEPGAIEEPHDPATVRVPPYLKDDLATREDLALYYDEISRMDGVIGTYVDELRQRGLLDNTLIIFFGDNGAPFPRAKGTLYDSGIGTPLVISWPEVVQSGRRYEQLVSVIDFAPTLLEVAGKAIPAEMQGKSISSVLQENDAPGREYVFSERNWHNGDEHMRSIRSADYKLIRNAYLDLPHGTASDIAASPSWKSLREGLDRGELTAAQAMLFEAPRPEYELYDLQADPWETVNLIDDPAHQEIAQRLQAELADWSQRTGDFPPTQRRRPDNVDRFTGEKLMARPPAMLPD